MAYRIAAAEWACTARFCLFSAGAHGKHSVNVGLGDLNADPHVGELELDCLEVDDRLVELLAGEGIVQAQLEAPLSHANSSWCEEDALDIEPAHDDANSTV